MPADLHTRIRELLDDDVDIILNPDPYTAALAAVLDLHVPVTVRPPCENPDDHESWEISVGEWVCADCGPVYTVCGECCMDGAVPSDRCSNVHDHTGDTWACPTVQAIADALDIKETS